jgi:porphyrinogen peroxidase
MATPAVAGASTSTRQLIPAPLTRAAIFLVVTINSGSDAVASVQSLCADLAALLRAVGFREPRENLSCIMGFGSEAWDRLFGEPRPAELHPFREFRGGSRHAVATPGDLLFHIRAERMDLCFELATQIMARLEGAVAPVDEVHGFRYFDSRDLLFGLCRRDREPHRPGSGGRHDNLHDMAGWNALPTEAQDRIIGRTKLSDIELDETIKPSWAHSALTVIEENGRETKIVRDNMPFGQPGRGEFGTYFIGYSRSPRTIEQMLENMFVGRPPGNYDRILDFSRAVSGNLFFVPTATFLEDVTSGVPAAAQPTIEPPADAPSQSIPLKPDHSLGIGSLKREPR